MILVIYKPLIYTTIIIRLINKIMKTEVYLVLFKNMEQNEERLVACVDVYDTLGYPWMKFECEYKDLSDNVLKDGWTFEKKLKEISWE